MIETRKGMQRRFYMLLICVTILAAFLYFTRYINPVYMPLVSCSEAATSLIYDPLMSRMSIIKLLRCGRRGLESVISVSGDFRNFNRANLLCVAELLEQSPDPLALRISEDLYSRQDNMLKLVGAVGLASHSRLNDFKLVVSIAQHERLSNSNKDSELLKLIDMTLKHRHN